MRFHWLLLTFLSSLLFALPAQAGRLLFWRFDSNQNRLTLTTDDRVQPRAQLIFNPTRVVLDLPGITLGRPAVNQPVGGAIRSVRVGQFNTQTTRVVIELAPGYTVDPQQVKIRGTSPTQWTVTLPTPERTSNVPGMSSPPPQSQRPSSTPTGSSSSGSEDLQVTRNGLFVRLERNGDNRNIKISRSSDNSSVQVDLPGASLPPSLASRTLTVNDYGVSTVQFSQVPGSSTPRLTLNVAANSPDWQAYYSRLGGLVLIPRGGVNVGSPGTSAPPSGNVSISQSATIQSLQLGSNNQLLIRADGTIRGQGRWNARERAYEIRIPKAQLADPLQGPQLNRNSPISQLRVRQENADTVVILVRPSSGFQTGQLSQLNSQLLGLDLRAQGATSRPPRPIDTPPPPITSPPSTPLPRVRNGKVLVVIDPGHGGKDPGAIGLGGIQEKDIILPISQMLANLLEQQGVQVLMTRTSDYFVGLQGRTDMANRADADLFVSIHANSMGKGRSDVNGLEVYYFGNRRLADTIHRSILASVNIRDRGVRRARFYVLRNSKMPSTLVEVGFVTGAEDSAKLTNPSYQRQMAEAIARGVLQFIGQNNLR